MGSMTSDAVVTPEQNMTVERLKGLYELIGRMNTVYNLQDLLEFVVDRALSLTGGHRGLLLLSDDQQPTLQDVAVVQGEALEEKDLESILEFVSATVIEDVLERGEPRLVSDLPKDKRYEGLTSFETLQFKKIRSVLAVPLKTAARLVGLIYIDHPRDGIFGQSDLDFLHAFANQAALAINRAREHQHQIKELTLLNELGRSVVQVLDLNEVLTRIVSEVIRMINVETGSVLLLDETNSELTIATSVSEGTTVKIPTRLKKDQGIAGWVMTHGEPACVNDVTQDPRWFGEVETGFVTRSLLCVPLQVEGRVVGVLEALNKKNPQGFLTGDITLLSAFAASATIAIKNAQLFQEARQAHQLRALNHVAMTLSSTLELKLILGKGLEQTLAILKADAGVINLIDDDTQTDMLTIQLRRGSLHASAQAGRQTGPLNSIASWMLSRKVDEIFVDDVIIVDGRHPQQELDGLNWPFSGIEALAIAPIKVSEVISGAIAIVSLEPHTYTLEEINLLNGIARIIGLAAQNAIYYIQTQAQTKRLVHLNEIGSALTRSLDLDQVLRVIIEAVNTLLQTELTSVFLIDDQTNELVLRHSTKGDAEIRLSYPWQGIAGWVASEDKPALVNNTQNDARHLRQIATETGYEAHSILCVPLKVEGQVIGVVEVLNKIGGQQFTLHHQAQLVDLTKWAAIALHNARLFDERAQAYERLDAEQQRRIAAETRGAMAAVILDMGHTINNIVGAIRVWASMLERATNNSPKNPQVDHKKTISQIRQNAEEALALMRTMTGPLEVAAVAPTDVHNCLDTAVKSCWCPDNIEITKKYGDVVPLVSANAKRLKAAFQNLISNAIQVMTPDGGQVQLHTGQNDEGWVEIAIADNGPGIPPELQKRIFNPGVSGKERGLGIGLWLVETFIRQFNGRVAFTSSASKGTTFRVTLQPVETNTETEDTNRSENVD
jgi:GAF domain-containing protein